MAWMAQYLRDCTGVPTVLTDHEAGIPAAGAEGPGAGRDRRNWPRWVARTYALADRIQALNAEDAVTLTAALGRSVAVRPAAVPWPTTPAEPARAPARLLFLGDYRHPPNPHAARFVARDVFPRVRTGHPEAELWLAGPHAEEAGIARLAADAGVRVLGRVDDLGALLRDVRALIAPVFQGGGSRIKVLTALAHGLPVAANSLGLRGIDASAPAVAAAEDADGLARACVTWLSDPASAGAAGTAARAWAREHASPEAAARIQLAVVADLLLNGRR
jgi:hypothetical protein